MVAPDISPIRESLLRVGFCEEFLRSDIPVSDYDPIPLIGFADRPFDSRTALVVVLQSTRAIQPSDIAGLRPSGAPLVFACVNDHCEFWTQGAVRPQFREHLGLAQLPSFFDQHRNSLSPLSIYRAKMWGRLEESYQCEFVDLGLMPVIEQEAGRQLTRLVERVVHSTKHRLRLRSVTEDRGRWLLQATFWLLAAKILQDKSVPGFVRLNLTDVEHVYDKVANHYNSENPRPVSVGQQRERDALIEAAEQIKSFGHCGSVSIEALAYLYESAMITRDTRRALGTHSTPPWLVDYIVGRLRPWIEETIPVDERRVFEPACGHAAFLVSAMRLLSDLLPNDWPEPRRTYLRRRLRGLEIDQFAVEIARLSLTLADVPNPNGWSLTEGDMFPGQAAQTGIEGASIVLGNPPFEDFKTGERASGWLPNKASEVFRRVVEHLPVGGVFGFVLPQTFLSSAQASAVRDQLLRQYEISEISLFADRVFRKGCAESAVLIGRRLKKGNNKTSVRYQRIREGQINEFSRTYRPNSVQHVQIERFATSPVSSLFLSDLAELWDYLNGFDKLADFAAVGQGFVHRSDDDPALEPGTVKVSQSKRPGFVPGYEGWSKNQVTHESPALVWFNLDPACIRRPHSGTEVGTPQVLLNYAPVSRKAWRMKALLDKEGHAVTSRFNVVRPESASLTTLWAILNSPIGNAYAYCHGAKRDVLAGTMRQLPVPKLLGRDLSSLENAVEQYLKAASTATPAPAPAVRHGKNSPADKRKQRGLFPEERLAAAELAEPELLKAMHWRIDIEVLRLYDLPHALERKLLDLFRGVRRKGVPFEQIEYFPQDFTELDRLEDLQAITFDWPETNARRAELINANANGPELGNLQRLADARVSLLKPVHIKGADRLIDELKRKGLWNE